MAADLFRILAEHIPGVVYLCANDETYTMKYLNARVEVLTGIPASEFLSGSVSFVDLFHPDDADSIGPLVDAALERREAYRLEYRLRHRDGSWRWIEEHGQGVFDEHGALSYLEGALFDITERVEAAARRRELEAQLSRAQKLESLGLLAGGVAHDFNNILLAIMGSIELAKLDLELGRPIDTLLDDALEAANHAADLTKQLLAYAGQGKRKEESSSFGSLLGGMRRLLESSVSRATTLHFELGEDASLSADKSLLQQVVLNLVINADDAIGAQPGNIYVRTGTVTLAAALAARITIPGPIEPGRYTWIEVEDDGAGMDPETARRIFEPFFSTKTTGHGLGMAALMGVLQTYRGGLELDSTRGVGTRFRLYLPVSIRVPSEAELDNKPTARGGPATILVVEDEHRVQRMIRDVLENLGHTMVAADSCAEGRRLIEQHAESIDLAIFDLNLPDGEGTQLYVELRAWAPTVPVLFSSGLVRPELADNTFHTAFLPKPYRPQMLADRVCELLGERVASGAT